MISKMNTIKAKKSNQLIVLNPEDVFRFSCHPGLDCFTRCCRNITIFLTPYDTLRLKNALGVSSSDFLAQHTVTLLGDAGLPVIVLKMQDDPEKQCPFVGPGGCSVYADRPWACRIFPLQPESTRATEKSGKAYYSVMDIPYCLGLSETKQTVLKDWIEAQGVRPYLEMESLFKKISGHELLKNAEISNQQIRDMYYMACYDLDRFRRFVLESSFLNRFEVEPQVVEDIRTDDQALYRFSMRWLEYGLLAQQILKIKPEVAAHRKEELGLE